MDAEAIIRQIGEDSRAEAQGILSDARLKAENAAREARERVALAREDARKKAAAEADESDKRMARMAELEEKKRMLSVKREVMDAAFERAYQLLSSMPADQARAYMLSSIPVQAAGDERVCPGANAAWADGDFVSQLNAALKKAGKPAMLTLSPACSDYEGVKLVKEGMELDFTWRATVNSLRLSLEAEAGKILYPDD